MWASIARGTTAAKPRPAVWSAGQRRRLWDDDGLCSSSTAAPAYPPSLPSGFPAPTPLADAIASSAQQVNETWGNLATPSVFDLGTLPPPSAGVLRMAASALSTCGVRRSAGTNLTSSLEGWFEMTLVATLAPGVVVAVSSTGERVTLHAPEEAERQPAPDVPSLDVVLAMLVVPHCSKTVARQHRTGTASPRPWSIATLAQSRWPEQEAWRILGSIAGACPLRVTGLQCSKMTRCSAGVVKRWETREVLDVSGRQTRAPAARQPNCGNAPGLGGSSATRDRP
mmetsp:Transcript_3126/g.9104  ORF Transcript_3126/g.9104 Transcript_3126/m.9104 type:complete len:283 (-) Transcript_3126:1440-2288(-)